MLAKTWYLGPLGDLRPLVCPDEGVSRPVERFGGVHQSLSGARTMDITGHRASYELVLPWLTAAESRFVEALHQRTVPGPCWLLDPLARNRLTRSAAMLLPYSRDVVATSGGTARSPERPDAVDVPVTSLDWSAYSAGASITLPPVPVLADETVTASVWARSAGTTQVDVSVTLLGLGQSEQGRETASASVGATWQRVSVTAAVSADAVSARLSLAADGTRVWLAAAQLADGDTPGAWDLGGGAPCVLVDQVGRTSPHYPRNDLSVTLLEV